MKTNNRRLTKGVAASLSLALSMLSVPMVSLADGDEIDTNYHIYVAGQAVLKSNSADVLGDGTVSYDEKTNTLTFKDAEIKRGYEVSGKTCGVYTLNPLNIAGNVSISDVDNGIITKDNCEISVNVQDGADIDIDCRYEGISAGHLDITNAKVKVNITGGEADNAAAFAIYGEDELTITHSVIEVTASSENETIYPNGICGPCTVGGGSVVNVKADNCGLWSWGARLAIEDAQVTVDAPVCIQYSDVDIIDENAVVNLTSYAEPDDSEVDAFHPKGIEGINSVMITAGAVIINSSDLGIYADCCEIAGESTYVYINAAACGIYCDTNLNISDVGVFLPEGNSFDAYSIYDEEDDYATEILLSHGHTMTKVDAAAPTTEKDGNIEYYKCETCGRYFKDENGLELIIDKSSVIIPKLDTEPTPIVSPTAVPTGEADPTSAPSATPTSAPVATATATPTAEPTVSATPTAEPTVTSEPTVTPTTEPAKTEDSKTQIRAFVDRIYKFVLDREPEEEGADFWTGELYNFTRSGAEVAQGFIFSAEFENRKTTDEQFVTILYKTFFDRDPEEDGMKFWLEQLSTGTMDRATVANGFIFSQEWADTCAAYGIRSGGDLKAKTNIEPTELTYNFVKRMYTTALAREAEEEGLKYWAAELANFNVTGEQVGSFFFLSDEMASFNLDDTEFLNRLYKTFMDRDADEDGAKYWLGVLASGTPRADVVMGFTRSPEFTAKCIDARILPFV